MTTDNPMTPFIEVFILSPHNVTYIFSGLQNKRIIFGTRRPVILARVQITEALKELIFSLMNAEIVMK
jgi:hypothetical protein